MNLQVIETREVMSNKFKIYGDLDNPLFLAKDVADWIEHTNITDMMGNVDDEDKLTSTIPNSGQKRKMWFLTEDGLYEVLMQSRKPIAKKFKKEVKKILKEIRKNGMYATDELLDNPDLLIEVATKLKEERTLRLVAEQRVAEYEPKISYLDSILESADTVTITQIAADYGLSAVAMNKRLNELKIQHKVGGQWILYTRHQREGYTKSHTTRVPKADGKEKVVMNTKWTQKGRLFIYESLKEINVYPLMDIEQLQLA